RGPLLDRTHDRLSQLERWRRELSLRCTRGTNEGPDLVRILFAERSLDADETSTPGARVMRKASETLSASSPPESMKGTPAFRSLRSVQSNGLPRPPGRVAPLGGRASKIRRSTTCAYWRI